LSNRHGKLTGERRSLVAVAVLYARHFDVPWKKLERIYGRTRRQLLRLQNEAEALMSQNRPLMSHLARGHGAGRDRMFDAFSSTLAVSDSMGGLFGGSTPAPVAPAASPTLSDAAVTNAARQEQITAARTRGRAATILTGGQGTTTAAPTQAKVLMGS
jgi:hypothetical protein